MIWRYEPGNPLSINAVIRLGDELLAGCALADDDAGVAYVVDEQTSSHDTVVSKDPNSGAVFMASAPWQNELGLWALRRREGTVTISLNHPDTGELLYRTGQRYDTSTLLS